MDPENVAMRVRLAEVYIRLGKKNEAWQIFSAAAETLRNRGSRGGAEEILQRMLTLDPGNSYALLLRARNTIESGDAAGAIPLFQKVHDLDSHPDGLRDLLKAYLQTGRVAEAGPLAAKLLNTHNDTQSMFSYVDALLQNNAQEDAINVIEEHADRLLAENSAKILETLRAVIGPLGNSPPALEKVLDLFHKAGDQSHDTEVHELLAHASVQSGDLARARELYQGLTEEEPQNPIHMQNYQQVVGMMGGSTGSKLLSVEEGIVLVEELEATAPPIDQEYSPEIANALRAAITDTELFVSYNMPDKALGPLMAVLPIAPSDVRLNQRLAALYVRSERFADAAACCRTLASVYNEAGLSEEGSRYEDLAQRCEEHASAVPNRASAPLTDEAEIPLAPWPMSSEATSESEETTTQVHKAHEPEEMPVIVNETSSEIDLSDEWDGALTAESAQATVAEPEAAPVEPAIEEISVEASDAVAETIEEVRFYLEHSMVDQARAAFVKLQSQTADYEQLAAIQAEIDAAVLAAPEVAPVEEASDEIPEAAVAHEETVPTHEEPASIPHEGEPTTPLHQMVAELDSSLGDGFLPDTVHHEIEQEQEITAHAGTDPGLVSHLEFMAGPKHAAPEPTEQPKDAGVLGEFVADLENSLGDGFLKEAPVATPEQPASIVAPVPVRAPEPSVAQSRLHMAASAASGAAPHSVPVPPAIESPAAAASAVAAQPSGTASTFRASVRPTNGTAAPTKPDLAASVDLADMFGEIRHELEEETTSSDEDPETHYNLGVAFREMGLLDEAIGELQKVCQSIDHGHGFPQVMQTYTWLAQCFLDKGVPEAAIRWYEKALALPSLDQETRTALHYELASSYETAQDKNQALQHFMEVYGSNIDYRDVGERIKALKS